MPWRSGWIWRRCEERTGWARLGINRTMERFKLLSKAAFERKSEENRVKACITDTSWGLSTTPGNHSSWIDVKIANGLGLTRTNDLFEETMAKGGKVSV